MSNVTVYLDGKPYEARADENILSLARRVGLGEHIPTLCYDPRLPPNGSCFVCVVEVDGMSRLQPSCATPVRDGMKVALRNDRVAKARKTALSLLLSNHDADCEGPCRSGCPAGIDVQGYLALVAEKRYEEAWRLIRERNPLVAICGRVCVRRCEDVCRRNLFEGTVGINKLKRVAADWAHANPVEDLPGPDNGHKVAIVGAGPAGLTVAYYLRKAGTAVTLFEALPMAGGMLRWGIPSYRLPRDVMDAEIESITRMGAEIRYGVTVGKDIDYEGLRAEGYEAIFVATGAPTSKKMRVEGEEGPGVLHGIDVLRDFGLGEIPAWKGKRVVIVGGGNTAIDVARTAIRLEAEQVRIVYRRTRKEMPAHDEEVREAIQEGAFVDYLMAPTRCVHKGDRLVGIECVQMQLGEPDASGRRRPVPIEGSEHVVPCDFVVAAIGQDADLRGLADGEGRPAVSRWGTLATDERTGATSVPGVFAAGDAVTGPMAVIDAIGAARRSAFAIQQYLEVGEAAAPPLPFTSARFGEVSRKSVTDAVGELPVQEPLPAPMVPHAEREGFAPVELALPHEGVVYEAGRCLQCGCAAHEDCRLRDYATEYEADPGPYLGDSARRRVDTRHPWITIDPNKCILCNRCVRTCGEVLGVSALGLIGRGFETRVAPAMDHSLLEAGCVSCGSCVEACPTGALTFAGIGGGRWAPTAETESFCGFCGVGCALEARQHGERFTVRSVRHDADDSFSDLCVRGRFGHELLGGEERLRTPLVRRGEALVPCTWDEAIAAAAAGLARARDDHGGETVAVSCSPRVPCEDALAAAVLAREALGTELLGSLELVSRRADTNDLARMLGTRGSTVGLAEIETADVILLAGTDPSDTRPVAALAIRRAVARGARLVVVSSGRTPLSDLARLWLNPRRGGATVALAGLCAAVAQRGGWPPLVGAEALRETLALITPESLARLAGLGSDRIEEAAELLLAPGATVALVADQDDALERAPDDLVALADLALLLEHALARRPGLLLLGAHANAEGLALAGVENHCALDAALRRRHVRAALLVGEDPAGAGDEAILEGLGFLVAMDHTLTDTARRADVVLPLASHLESGGTFVSADGVARSLDALRKPLCERAPDEVLGALAAALGHKAPPARGALSERLGLVPGARVASPSGPARLVAPSLAPQATQPAPPTRLAIARRVSRHIRATLGRPGPR